MLISVLRVFEKIVYLPNCFKEMAKKFGDTVFHETLREVPWQSQLHTIKILKMCRKSQVYQFQCNKLQQTQQITKTRQKHQIHL